MFVPIVASGTVGTLKLLDCTDGAPASIWARFRAHTRAPVKAPPAANWNMLADMYSPSGHTPNLG